MIIFDRRCMCVLRVDFFEVFFVTNSGPEPPTRPMKYPNPTHQLLGPKL